MVARKRRNSLACAGVLSLLLAYLVPAGAAGNGVLFLTSDSGPLSEVATAMAQELVGQGVMPQFAQAIPADLGSETVVVTGDNSLAEEAVRVRLMTHLQAGGGVVLLVEPSPEHYAQANLLLGLLGALAEEVSDDKAEQDKAGYSHYRLLADRCLPEPHPPAHHSGHYG